MVFYGHHGVTATEREKGTSVEVDCVLYRDLRDAGSADDLNKSIDVRDVYTLIESIVLESRFYTMEALAERISDDIIRRYSPEKVVIRVSKPHPPEMGNTGSWYVEIEREP